MALTLLGIVLRVQIRSAIPVVDVNMISQGATITINYQIVPQNVLIIPSISE